MAMKRPGSLRTRATHLGAAALITAASAIPGVRAQDRLKVEHRGAPTQEQVLMWHAYADGNMAVGDSLKPIVEEQLRKGIAYRQVLDWEPSAKVDTTYKPAPDTAVVRQGQKKGLKTQEDLRREAEIQYRENLRKEGLNNLKKVALAAVVAAGATAVGLWAKKKPKGK